MIRSLVIRQVFRVTDVILAVGVLGVIFFVVKLFLTPLPTIDMNGTAAVDSIDASKISQLAPREVYDSLVESGLFGAAGKNVGEETAEVAEVAPIDEDIQDSELNLKLRGTIALEPGDPFASAFIENLDSNDGVRSYLLGGEVVTDVFVNTISKREVILLNQRKDPHQRERLRMEDPTQSEENSGSTGQLAENPGMPERRGLPAAPVRPVTDRSSRVQHTRVNRNAIVREAIDNYAQLATITPKVETDDSGNVLGLTADNIGQYPLAEKLGFQDGDVLQTVNNERIDSREKLLELFQRYQNASSFRVGILRNGQPNILVFDVE